MELDARPWVVLRFRVMHAPPLNVWVGKTANGPLVIELAIMACSCGYL